MELEDFKAAFGDVEIPEEAIQAAYDKVAAEIKDAHNGTTNRTLSEVDTYVASLAGVEKEHGELTKDFVARALKTQTEAIASQAKQEADQLKAKIAEAEKAGSGVPKEQVEQLQAQLVQLKEAEKAKEKEFETKLTQIQRQSQVSAIEAGLVFDEGIKPSILELVKREAANKVKEAHTVEVGGKLYASEDGNSPILSDGKAVPFDEYVKSLYADVLAPEAPRGNGANSDAGKADALPVEGVNQLEVYDKYEKKLRQEGVPRDEARAKLQILATSDAFNALPIN